MIKLSCVSDITWLSHVVQTNPKQTNFEKDKFQCCIGVFKNAGGLIFSPLASQSYISLKVVFVELMFYCCDMNLNCIN